MLDRKDKLQIAQELIGKRKYAEAEDVLLEAMQDDSDLFVRDKLADLYIRMNRLDEAEDHVSAVLKSEPENVYSLQKKGDILAKRRKYNDALAVFLDLYERGERSYFLVKRIFRTYFLQKKYDKALEYALLAEQKNPDKSDVYYHLFLIYSKSGDEKKASESIDKALKMEPDNEFYYSQRLSFVMENENRDASELEDMLEISGEENPNVLQVLAKKYKDSGELEKAEQFYKKLISIDNSDFNRKNLGFLYYKMKDFGKAFRIFLTMPDSYYLDNVFITSIMNSAVSESDITELIGKLTGLADKSPSYKKLWGRVKTLNKKIEVKK